MYQIVFNVTPMTILNPADKYENESSIDLLTSDLHPQPVMGAFETPLPFLSVPNQSVRNTSDDIRAALRTQRTAVSHMRYGWGAGLLIGTSLARFP